MTKLRRFWSQLLNAGLLAASLLLIVVFLLDGVFEQVWPPLRTAVSEIVFGARLAAGIVALLLFMLLIMRIKERHVKGEDDQDRPKVRQLTGKAVSRILDNARGMRPARVYAYGHLVAGLRGRTLHTHEKYEVIDNSFRRTVTSHYRLSPEMQEQMKGDSIPFPITTVSKGHLPDHLEVRLADGRLLAIMPYDEILSYQLLVLDALWKDAMGSNADRTILSGLAYQIARYGRLRDKYGIKVDEGDLTAEFGDYFPAGSFDASLEAEFEQRRGDKPSEDQQAALATLKGFVRTYTDAYPICVEIPASELKNHFTLQFEHTLRLREDPDRFADRLRQLLGLSPFKFRVPVVLPYLARSYHLSIVADPSVYLFSQRIETRDGTWRRVSELCAINEGPDAVVLEPPYARFKHWDTTNLSHLYMRGFQELPSEDLEVTSRFHEKLPGVLGLTTVMSVFLTACILALGSMPDIQDGSAPVDVVALLAALPGAAGLIWGGRTGVGHSHVSLTTRLGLIATVALSGVSVFLFGAQAQGQINFPDVPVSVFGLAFPVKDPAWQVLLLVSVSVTCLLVGVYANRAKAFFGRLWARPGSAPRHEAIPDIPHNGGSIFKDSSQQPAVMNEREEFLPVAGQ